MAVTCQLLINDIEIGFVYAQRFRGSMRPDSLGTYRVVVEHNDERWEGTVRHRYGDGAWALVQRVLEAVGDSFAERVVDSPEVRSGRE